MKVIINNCFGGYGLSDEAYEWLIARGIPVQKYIQQERDADTGLYKPQPANDGRVIFDRELTPRGECSINDIYHEYKGKTPTQQRYWDCWIDAERSDPLIIECVEALGEKASGPLSKLKIVEIPDGVEYVIQEYDGNEHIAEAHRTWG